MKNSLRCLLILGVLLSFFVPGISQEYPLKKILVVVEGSSDLKNYAMGDGRQLAELLGHFNTAVTVKGVNKYFPGEVNTFDFTFYIGFNPRDAVPPKFTDDVLSTSKPVIWMNTGMIEFSKRSNLRKKFGFSVSTLDSLDDFNYVKSNNKVFTKGEPNANIIEISNRRVVEVLAVAYSSRKRREIPYIVRSKNFMYIADSPFASATENDRYLLFADMLHDILHEQHEESHSALIRIEDVDPLSESRPAARHCRHFIKPRNSLPCRSNSVLCRPVGRNPREFVRQTGFCRRDQIHGEERRNDRHARHHTSVQRNHSRRFRILG